MLAYGEEHGLAVPFLDNTVIAAVFSRRRSGVRRQCPAAEACMRRSSRSAPMSSIRVRPPTPLLCRVSMYNPLTRPNGLDSACAHAPLC